MIQKNKELAILIYSCWKNSDMWEIFSKLFSKYWNDCAFKVILLTDYFEASKQNHVFDDIVILDGKWDEMIKAGIDKAGTRYVMLWMDDYLLCDYVKNEDVLFYLEMAKCHQAANVRLVESPTIPSVIYDKDPRLNYYAPGTAYSFSTQVGIWDTAFLLKNINPGWSPWDFERKGSLEIKDYDHPLLASRDYVFPYEEGVRKGRWMDAGVRICKRNGIQLDFSRRKQMSNLDLAWIYFKGAILEMNPNSTVKIQNLLGRLRK